jgi:hypothetical protein
MNKILIDYGRDNTTLWFGDGFTTLKGDLMEVAYKIYNISTIKYVDKYGLNDNLILQEKDLYIDNLGYSKALKDILVEKYKLKVNNCKIYEDKKDYDSEVQIEKITTCFPS